MSHWKGKEVWPGRFGLHHLSTGTTDGVLLTFGPWDPLPGPPAWSSGCGGREESLLLNIGNRRKRTVTDGECR